MRTRDVIFLIAVVATAAVFAGQTLSSAWDVLATPASVEFGARGGAGVARDVDVERVRRLIEAGTLSDREAEYYRAPAAELAPENQGQP